MKGILCFGDSITFGIGESPAIGWAGRLKQSWETANTKRLYNLGIGGQTSGELLQRFDIECAARLRFKTADDSYVLIIAIGTNDAKDDVYSPEQFESNIKGLIAKAKTYNARSVFLGLPIVDGGKLRTFGEQRWRNNDQVEVLNEIIKRCCAQENMPFLDLYPLLGKEQLIDGVHPDSEGYDILYLAIRAFLIEQGLLDLS